ncbi:MAG: iron-sulfur cluster assembly scaffold protein [Desulfobacteraceae bacterium IS3]|nr:MAG: iron-sulfur cluster assembly scaffold protein [Desulfobacteraceae bacterium IS3]
MEDKFDKFANELQEQIFEETRESFGEIAYQRWRYPLYLEAMENPDGHANVRGGCGDAIEIFLKFENDRVKKASFQVDGCGASLVCGSFAAEMAFGKTATEILEIGGDTILKKLEIFPEENEHCAFLAAKSLHEAVNDYKKKS